MIRIRAWGIFSSLACEARRHVYIVEDITPASYRRQRHDPATIVLRIHRSPVNHQTRIGNVKCHPGVTKDATPDIYGANRHTVRRMQKLASTVFAWRWTRVEAF